MPTKVKEIQQTHYIIDQTYRGETMNSETVIAGVVAASTGPCDEMVIDSVSELADLYLNGDSITADSDVTLQHAAKILQFSPIHIVRAANDKIKAGVTNMGDVIYTDVNYNPFKYSSTFEIKPLTESKTGYIGFTGKGNDTTKETFVVWGNEEQDKTYIPDYLDTLIKSDGSTDVIKLELAETSETPVGIDSLFNEIKTTNLKDIPSGIGFDFENKEKHVVYTDEYTEFDIYPGYFSNVTSEDSSWLTVDSSDISSEVFKLSVNEGENSFVNEGEGIINLNGYSFYLGVNDETKDVSVSGNGVEININREEGTSVSPKVFGLYVFDEIVKSDKIKNPVISKVDSSFSFYVDGGVNDNTIVTFLSNMDDLLEIHPSPSAKEEGDLLNGRIFTVEKMTNIKFTVKFKVSPDTLISSEKYFFVNFSSGESGYVVPEVKTVEATSSLSNKIHSAKFSLENIFNDTVELKLKIKENGIEKAYATTIPYESSTFKNWTGSYKNISADFSVDSSNNKIVEVRISGLSNKDSLSLELEYVPVEFKDETKTYALYFNQSSTRPYENVTVGVGSISIPMAVYKMGVALSSISKEEGDDCAFTMAQESDIVVDTLEFYGLKSYWRTLSSTSSYFEVSSPSKFTRTLVSKDSYNNTQEKDNFVLKIGNIVFWNGKKGLYTPSSNSEDTYRIGNSTMTFESFMAAVVEELPSFVSTIPSISDGNKITIFSNSKEEIESTSIKFGSIFDEKLEEYDGALRSFEYELTSRFAIIASYPSTAKIFGLKMTSRDDETFDISVRRKTTTSTFNVSFIPDTVNGYGTNIYYDYINSDMIDFKAIDLNVDADPVEIEEEITFGDEIVVPEPGLTQRKNALSKFTLETGYYYNYLTELGYTNASFDIFANSIAETLNAQYLYAAPKDYLTKSLISQYRDTVGVDSRNSILFTPFYKDNTLGNFVVDMSPTVQVLQRLINNKKMFKEFAPAFGPTNGEVAISTKMSSSSGLLVDFNLREDREEMLAKQINTLRIDRGLGIVYINDMLTNQKKDSYLSDFNNMYMTNLIQHLLDTFLKQYYAYFNNKATRDNVVTVLTRAFQDRLFANQLYTPFGINVICDENNNPTSVVNDRKLIVDVEAFYEVAIKYIDTYTRVLNLSEA